MEKRLGNVLFYAIVVIVAYLLYLIFAPFLVALAWAAVLVVVSYPFYEWLARRWGRTGSALATTIAVTLILIVPTLLVMVAFVRQAVVAAQSIHLGFEAGHFTWVSHFWDRLQAHFPELSAIDLTAALHRYAERVAAYVGEQLGTVLRHMAEFLFDLGVTILAMFYLYRDGDSMVTRLREVMPFDSEHRDRILRDARDLVFASVTSSLVAAAIHGTLGGLAFGATGIRAPVFWGVMMGFCSLVPVIGTALVWVPITISLLVQGHAGRAIVLLILCIAIVSVVDNVIRPWLISGRGEMGGLVIFISVIGGVAVFGMLGVVLGPIVVATAASVLDLHAPHVHAGNRRTRAGGKKVGAVVE